MYCIVGGEPPQEANIDKGKVHFCGKLAKIKVVGGGGGRYCWLGIAGIIRRFNFHTATHATKLDSALYMCICMYECTVHTYIHEGLARAWPCSVQTQINHCG